MANQKSNGAAFEWAVGSYFERKTGYSILTSDFSSHAKKCYDKSKPNFKSHLDLCAGAACEHLLELEKLFFSSPNGSITFPSDSEGQSGDVRDIIIRNSNDKEIGISTKNNHEALKHPRLSDKINFVKDWGLSDTCSPHYFSLVRPIFESLRSIRNISLKKALWRDQVDKADVYYWPILNAFEEEVMLIKGRSVSDEADLCRGMISYIIGRKDFYKVIAQKKAPKGVLIQAYNFNGTLAVRKNKYPAKILSIINKNGSQCSKTITFNGGFSINFRIHTASSRVEPSLKFDIKAIGLPTDIYTNHIQT
jgi:hypothetical protein